MAPSRFELGRGLAAPLLSGWRARRWASPWSLATLLVCTLGLYLRVRNAGLHLGPVSMDENDVVEQAVAFMGGDWRYYLLEYGALPMYLLAGVYHLAALAHGVTGFEYAQRVFFDGTEHYFIARLASGLCLTLLAVSSYRFLAPRFGRSAGLVGAGLLGLPEIEGLTNGVVRIDTFQATWQMLALLGLVKALESRRTRHWLWAGAAAGLGIASKPMPGLLITPCFILASWFAASEGDEAAQGASAERPRLGQVLRRSALRVVRTLGRPQLWGAALATLFAAAAGNPTSIDLPAFVQAQSRAVGFYSGARAPGLHLDAFQAAETLGVPFLLAAGLSLLVLLWVSDVRARLIALFPLLYVTAFWGRPVRTYYLVAPALALCWTIAIVVGVLLCRWGLDECGSRAPDARGMSRATSSKSTRARWLVVPLLLALLGCASYGTARRLHENLPSTFVKDQARAWIHQNIPSDTAIFQYGTYSGAGGPILVANDARREAELAQFFVYGRGNYDFFRRAYQQAYSDYVSQGRPRYAIEAFGLIPQPKGSSKTPAWVAGKLDRRAQRRGQEYILLCHYRDTEDVYGLGYDWLPRVELVQQFGDIALFRVPKASSP
jgi:Dolichyl-phosphate-mannose-protein mannosyltransferase